MWKDLLCPCPLVNHYNRITYSEHQAWTFENTLQNTWQLRKCSICRPILNCRWSVFHHFWEALLIGLVFNAKITVPDPDILKHTAQPLSNKREQARRKDGLSTYIPNVNPLISTLNFETLTHFYIIYHYI